VDRLALADFLRRRRAGLTPAQVHLAPGARRRTPGLRREEVAALAGISVDYCVRLEQGRGPHPSPAVLSSLATALRLTDDERDHLYRLAGQQPPVRWRSPERVSPGLRLILDRMPTAPAMVINGLGTVLAQNALSRALGGVADGENLIRRYFTDPDARLLFPPEDRDGHARRQVRELRALCGARPDDPRPAALAAELRAASAEFAALWQDHEVAVRRRDSKVFLHPVAGRLDLDCEVLLGPGGDQRLVLHTPRPGTPAGERLALLAAPLRAGPVTVDGRPGPG
jgi:transcriptional regulator with XRE-family HTH domain